MENKKFDKWEDWMDIPKFTELQKRLKNFMDSVNSATTQEILNATGFTEREFIYSNGLVKAHPNTFWSIDFYEFDGERWYNVSVSKSEKSELIKLRQEVTRLARENTLLKRRLEVTGSSKLNV